MLYVREHADEWNVDPERILVCGFSAGGHNAAMLATCYSKPYLTKALHTTPQMLRPAGAILSYPVTDFTLQKDETEAQRAANREFLLTYLGTSEPTDELLQEVATHAR